MTTISQIEKVLTGNFSSSSSLLEVRFPGALVIYDYLARKSRLKIEEEGIDYSFPLDDENLLLLKKGKTGFFIVNWITRQSSPFYQALGDTYKFVTGIKLNDTNFVLINETGALHFYYRGVTTKRWIIQTPIQITKYWDSILVNMSYQNNYLVVTSQSALLLPSNLLVYLLNEEEKPILIFKQQETTNGIEKAVFTLKQKDKIQFIVAYDRRRYITLFSIENNKVIEEKKIEVTSFDNVTKLSLIPLINNRIALSVGAGHMTEIYDIKTGKFIKVLNDQFGFPILAINLQGQEHLLSIGNNSHLSSIETSNSIFLTQLRFNNQPAQDANFFPISKFKVKVLRCLLERRLRKLIPKDLIRELNSFLDI